MEHGRTASLPSNLPSKFVTVLLNSFCLNRWWRSSCCRDDAAGADAELDLFQVRAPTAAAAAALEPTPEVGRSGHLRLQPGMVLGRRKSRPCQTRSRESSFFLKIEIQMSSFSWTETCHVKKRDLRSFFGKSELSSNSRRVFLL